MGNYFNKEYKFYKSKEKKEKFESFNGFIGTNIFPLEEDAPIKKSQKLFKEAQKDENYEKYVEALKYNNTDEKIILKILGFKTSDEEKRDFLQKYGLYLSENNYNKFFGKKKESNCELFKALFDLLKDYHPSISSIESIWIFVENFSHYELRNVFSTNINDELLFHFQDLTKIIQRLIFNIKYIILNEEMDFETKFKSYFLKDEQKDIEADINKILPSIKGEKEKNRVKNNILLIHYSFFQKNFIKIKKFIIDLYNEILYFLNNMDDINLYILLYIKDMIINILLGFDNIKNYKIIKKIKKYYKEKTCALQNPKEKEEIDIKEYKLIMDRKNDILIIKYFTFGYYGENTEKILTIKNSHLYDLELIKDDINFNLSSNISLEFQLLKYVKIEYLNEHNYIKYSQNFINDFLKKMLKSKTILSLLKKIYPGSDKYSIFKESSDFLNNLAQKLLERYYFIELFLGKGGATYPEIKRINHYTFNRYDESLETKEDFIIYLLENIGCFIYIFHHEFLGHFLLHYFSIITKGDFDSPFSEIDGKGESGRFIEHLLYGKRVKILNFLQLLFILDIDNYELDYQSFKSKFNKQDYFKLSINFKNMIKEHFSIDLNESDFKIEKSAKLFGSNIIDNINDIYVENATFESCISFNNIDFIYTLNEMQKKNV